MPVPGLTCVCAAESTSIAARHGGRARAGGFLHRLDDDSQLDLHFGAMRRHTAIRLICIFGLAVFMAGALAQDADLTQIKERELEQVREQISRLKQSMDKRAANRDRITGELQAAEVKISETRIHLLELERQRDFTQKKKAEVDARLEAKAAELAQESRQLEAQVRSRLYQRRPGTHEVAAEPA